MSETTKITAGKPEAKRDNEVSLVQKKERVKTKAVPAVDNILHLQHTIGNQAVQKLFKSGTIQPKLKIGKPGDKYELEADRIADQVMSMPEMSDCLECKENGEKPVQTKPITTQITPLVRRQVDTEEEEEEPIQAKLDASILQKQVEPEEEEEPIQTRPISEQLIPLAQRQAEEEEEEEEEEELQAKPITEQITPLVQRQEEEEEEEEPIQSKLDSPILQKQVEPEEEEEEPIQTKPISEQITPVVQRQTEEEEEEPIQAQLDSSILQKQIEPEEEEEPVQTKGNSSNAAVVTPGIESSINSLRGKGQPLSESTRNYFEPRFGDDFSHVRIRADSKAAETAKSINARAFTTGKNVVFGAGQYSPDTSYGRNLLAHELTHVIQQNKSSPTNINSSKDNNTGNVILRDVLGQEELLQKDEEYATGVKVKEEHDTGMEEEDYTGGDTDVGEQAKEKKGTKTKSIVEEFSPLVQKQGEEEPEEEEEEEEEELIQTKSNSSAAAEVIPTVESSINSLKGGGQPLPESTRSYFEPRFGYDFSGVRVHADSKGTALAQAVNAKAYTVGHNIVFNTKLYTPYTDAGRRLLAHELVHVTQQEKGGGLLPSPSRVASSQKKESSFRKSNSKVTDATSRTVQTIQISRVSTKRLARAIIFEAPPELTREFIAMWEKEISKETDPKKIARYKRYIQNLKHGTPLDPIEAGWKAEREWRYVYKKEIGVSGERQYKGGHPAGPVKGSSKPDIGGKFEVKATDITSSKTRKSIIRKLKAQLSKRQFETLPAHFKSQPVIIDLRASGKKVTKLQIENFEKQLLRDIKFMRAENIQVVVNKGQIIRTVRPEGVVPKSLPKSYPTGSIGEVRHGAGRIMGRLFWPLLVADILDWLASMHEKEKVHMQMWRDWNAMMWDVRYQMRRLKKEAEKHQKNNQEPFVHITAKVEWDIVETGDDQRDEYVGTNLESVQIALVEKNTNHFDPHHGRIARIERSIPFFDFEKLLGSAELVETACFIDADRIQNWAERNKNNDETLRSPLTEEIIRLLAILCKNGSRKSVWAIYWICKSIQDKQKAEVIAKEVEPFANSISHDGRRYRVRSILLDMRNHPGKVVAPTE